MLKFDMNEGLQCVSKQNKLKFSALDLLVQAPLDVMAYGVTKSYENS
jgi:hypothetical protein